MLTSTLAHVISLVPIAHADVPIAPDAYLGHSLAADFTLPDWDSVRGYFERLDRESGRVALFELGKTTEGRAFVVAAISSEANLARADEIKRCAATCHDPRGASPERREEALAKGVPILAISCAMHATECAAPQFAMQLAWELATSDAEPYRSAREKTLVLLMPSANPDGLDHVAKWYARTVGTPYEASELPELYQRYAGHDNNRDWFALTQQETRLVTRMLYFDWRPQVYWDVHQQGSKQERMFVPPFRDPLDPNLDAGVVCGINLLGTRAQLDMTRDGKTGVATGGTYDMWWNGGNRNVPVRHNVVGLLSEAASCRLASPIFVPRDELRSPTGAKEYAASNAFPDPWPGGWWRLADVVEYELACARSLLASLAREPRFWLANQMEAADRTIRGDVPGMPSAWIVSSANDDAGALVRLCDVLLQSGVELDAAERGFDAAGRSFPAGSIVIRAAQPYARCVKDLFDVQRYPQGDAPYDVAGWTLPALFGLDACEMHDAIDGELAAKLVRVKDLADARARIAARPGARAGELSVRDSDAWKELFARLSRGEAFQLARDGDRAGRFDAISRGDGSARQGDAWFLDRVPRVGVHAPWSGNADEGWTRWVFESFGVPYATVHDDALRAGSLREAYDVLVLPGIGASELDRGRAEGTVFDAMTGGLDPDGAAAIEEFVRAGGTLIAAGGSCAWAIDLCSLPVVDSTKDEKEFSCPGSVLRAIPEARPLASGLPDTVNVFGSSPKAFRAMTEKERETAHASASELETLLAYAPTRTLLSGWLAKPEAIAGRAAWMRATHGKGRVHLFGFRPQYRGWNQAAFQLLFRALLLDAPRD